ncbi:ankyrin repeat domain-containing protein [Paenibacillus daejeonensis]|uniref:ankyrin repeat domain-containing protein n=1 Tax=Paenibacillus daejeonensis TaxID=135193 RepID=UPI000381DBF5|nr:ankyrin repeat domain-containing protein [Paenibacillus daejeonensis]
MRFFIGGLLLILAWGTLVGTSVTAKEVEPIRVYANQIELDLAVPAIMLNGSIMLHAKSILDALKIKSTIDAKQLIISHETKSYRINVGQTRVHTGGTEVSLAQAPVNLEGRIYVPARLISLVLDQSVSYEGKTKQLFFGLSPAAKEALQRSLFEAVRVGDMEAIHEAVSKGADPNGKLFYLDHTPLWYAIDHNHTEGVRTLIHLGAILTPDEYDLVGKAIAHNNNDMLELLLEAGLDPNHTYGGRSFLEMASSSVNGQYGSPLIEPSVATVDLLLRYGADPSRDRSLDRAIETQHYPILRALLRAGADTHQPDEFGVTPYERSQLYNISSWMEDQELPGMRIQTAEGQELREGRLQIRSSSSQVHISHAQGISWRWRDIYIGQPVGAYHVMSIRSGFSTYFLPKSFTLTVQGDQVLSNPLILPVINVRGQLTSDKVSIQDGNLLVFDTQNQVIEHVYVQGQDFQMSAPAGNYRIISYRDDKDEAHFLKGTIQVTGDKEIERPIVVLE